MIDFGSRRVTAGVGAAVVAGLFRIVSWNIERGLQFPRILDFLRTIRGGSSAVAGGGPERPPDAARDVAAEFAKALNLNHAFGTEFQELSEGTAARPAFHGNATLSPWPISNVRIIRFRRQSKFWQPRWYVPELAVFQRRIGGRIALGSGSNDLGTKGGDL